MLAGRDFSATAAGESKGVRRDDHEVLQLARGSSADSSVKESAASNKGENISVSVSPSSKPKLFIASGLMAHFVPVGLFRLNWERAGFLDKSDCPAMMRVFRKS
jgi:hypothetical protein